MKHLKTFENFNQPVEEHFFSGLVSALGGTPYAERMKETLEKNLQQYINQAIERNYADGATEDEFLKAKDLLINAEFKLKNLKKANPEITEKEAKLAEYLFKRADTSVSHLANAGHSYGSAPKV